VHAPEPATREPDLADMIAEVKREIAMRENFYPLRIRDRKLNPKAAHWQIAVMRAVLARLIELNGGKDSAPGILI
jgi:hypothetical protein